MMIQAAIFDLDGTLLDTLQDIAEATNEVLCSLGFAPHPVSAYRLFVGDGIEALAHRVLPPDRRADKTIASVVSLLRKGFLKRGGQNVTPYGGIPEIVEQFKLEGIALAILSNKPDDAAQKSVKQCFPKASFEIVVGAREAAPKKPDPAQALHIASVLSVSPEHTLFIGDTHIDMQTARNARMVAVGVLWGFRPADDLICHGAQILVKNPSDLHYLI
jgi:phosphoglycolate phosphatase